MKKSAVLRWAESCSMRTRAAVMCMCCCPCAIGMNMRRTSNACLCHLT